MKNQIKAKNKTLSVKNGNSSGDDRWKYIAKCDINPINVIVCIKWHTIDHTVPISRNYLLKSVEAIFHIASSGVRGVNFPFHLWPNVSFISQAYFVGTVWASKRAYSVCVLDFSLHRSWSWICIVCHGIVEINYGNEERKLLDIKYHFIASIVSHAKCTICVSWTHELPIFRWMCYICWAGTVVRGGMYMAGK